MTRIVQLSDTHLLADPEGRVVGHRVQESFQRVLAAVAEERAELVVVTGDVAHDASEEAYVRFRTAVEALGVPVLCVPGNHDDPLAMGRALAGEPFVSGRQVQLAGWTVVALDSSAPGEEGGELGGDELIVLERALGRAWNRHVLVCLHHHPVALAAAWMNDSTVADADALFEVIRRSGRVRGVLFGHGHHEVAAERDGVTLLGAPSTCHQFLPGTAEPEFDDAPPGYRVVELGQAGELVTRIARVN